MLNFVIMHCDVNESQVLFRGYETGIFSTFSVPSFDPRGLDYRFAAFSFTLSPVFVIFVYIQLMNC